MPLTTAANLIPKYAPHASAQLEMIAGGVEIGATLGSVAAGTAEGIVWAASALTGTVDAWTRKDMLGLAGNLLSSRPCKIQFA